MIMEGNDFTVFKTYKHTFLIFKKHRLNGAVNQQQQHYMTSHFFYLLSPFPRDNFPLFSSFQRRQTASSASLSIHEPKQKQLNIGS